MPFVPHTPQDVAEMLAAIGVGALQDLFEEIPSAIRLREPLRLPPSMSEAEVARLMQQRAKQDEGATCFIGAGAYDHHVPAAVWDLVVRGEFYSAYTPYQAEASQGTLQVLYEYQTMMAGLMAMDVSNASLYDGASSLAEAVLMAVRINRKGAKCVLMPRTVHPIYRAVVKTIAASQGVELLELPYVPGEGHIDRDALEQRATGDCAALVVPQPNFFGLLEEAHTLTDWAHERGLLVIGLINPVAAAILAPPGEWGGSGADIACGEGQPLGVPLSCGGPYFGFLTCKRQFVRQMPGRLVGGTVDVEGRRGFTLTLQAREQHIRRSKATSNICTNQGLLVTAATIHMALLGAEGLARVARACHATAANLIDRLAQIRGVEQVFDRPFFHEGVMRVPWPGEFVLSAGLRDGLLCGYDLEPHYPELKNCLLVCATEVRSAADVDRYAAWLDQLTNAECTA
jgi:glycine dehydrogenase subunit 1